MRKITVYLSSLYYHYSCTVYLYIIIRLWLECPRLIKYNGNMYGQPSTDRTADHMSTMNHVSGRPLPIRSILERVNVVKYKTYERLFDAIIIAFNYI